MDTCSNNESTKTLNAIMEWNFIQKGSDERMPVQFRQTITTMIEALINPERLKRDLFFALLLLFMKENGFLLLKGTDKGSTSILDYILSLKDKRSTIYEVVFILNGFTETPLKIIAVPISDAILINAIIPDIDNRVFSLCLDLNKYIAVSALGVPSYFKNYVELCHSFKNEIVTPSKCVILNHHGYPSCNLAGLPEHVIHQIMLYLPPRSVLNSAECCKRLNDIANDDRLWRRLYDRDFSDFREHKTEEKDWRDTYREMYLIKQDAFRQTNRILSGSYGEIPDLSDYIDSGPGWQIIL